MAKVLLDPGAVVALVNRGDRNHREAANWFRIFRGVMLTTETMVTETAYVLAASPVHQHAALLWFERARAAGMVRIEEIADYAVIDAVIDRFSSLPCDYADASLIALAEQTGVAEIVTVDQRHFSLYRLRNRRRFRILIPA